MHCVFQHSRFFLTRFQVFNYTIEAKFYVVVQWKLLFSIGSQLIREKINWNNFEQINFVLAFSAICDYTSLFNILRTLRRLL